MNRRSIVGISGFSLLALSGCGNTDPGDSAYLPTIESLEEENLELRNEIAHLQESITPTLPSTPLPAYVGAIADGVSIEVDGWILESTGYAPLEYLMGPPNSSTYQNPDAGKFDVFVFTVANIGAEPRVFSRESWVMVDDLDNTYQTESSHGFDSGPAAKEPSVEGGATREVWIVFESARERIPQELTFRIGNATWPYSNEFPGDTEVLLAPRGKRYTTAEPRRSERGRRDASVPGATPVTKDGEFTTWGDWDISNVSKLNVESADGLYLQMTIANMGELPMAFPADRLALIDNYNRWYQISSLYMPSDDSFSLGEDLEGVELDPGNPVEVWISVMSEVERDTKYLVSMDRTLAMDIT